MKKFFKSIYKFFLKIYIFESYAKFVRLKKSRTTSFFIKSKKEVNINRPIKKYFEKDKYKLIRFRKNSKFMGLKLKNEIVCSGWVYFGNKWKIDEIDKKISLNKRYLLYDFITEKKFRNKGYYQLLLKKIQNKFQGKKLIIYALSHNNKSIRVIEKSGFNFIKALKKYRD